MSNIFTKDNFVTEVIEASKTKPVLVDFFAPWCGPCQIQAPIVEALAEELGDKVVIGSLDTDQALEIAKQYGVMSIPTIIIFRNGEAVEKFVGVQEKDFFKEILAKYSV